MQKSSEPLTAYQLRAQVNGELSDYPAMIADCDKAIALAMRIHGAMGLSRELGLEELARDVRTLTIPDGTPGILTLIQGRELTGIDPFR